MKKPPKYRHYKPKNLAVVRIDGKDHYLGTYDSFESWERYYQLLAERASSGKIHSPAEDDLTVSDMLLRYRDHAKQKYFLNEKPGKEYVEMKYAARPLRELCGSLRVRLFGPKNLKLVQQHMVQDDKLSRRVINHRISRIRRIFRWAESEGLVSPGTLHGLKCIEELRYGQTTARECARVKAVPQCDVDPVLVEVTPVVSVMIQVQLLTGMRPGELVRMKHEEIDKVSAVWVYQPSHHKNSWRELEDDGKYGREIPLGPKAQALLNKLLPRETGFVFCPRESEDMRHVVQRQNRQTPMTPSQAARKPKRDRKRPLRESYTVDSYRRAITYGIEKVNEKRRKDKQPEMTFWSPHQLRHAAATRLRKKYGIEAAQISLGHTHADVTQIYAERDRSRMIEIAWQQG